MTEQRDNLIADLVADVEPVARPGRIAGSVWLWTVVAFVYSSIIVVATGPIRPLAFEDLIAYPLFGLETVIALAFIVALPFAAMRSAIPDAQRPQALIALSLFAGVAWLAFYVIGLWTPVHPVSMLGKRDHCIWQTMLFAVPTMGFLLMLARRLMPLWPRTTAALSGAAAAAIPGAWMQFACMYVPSHIMTHHLAPVVIMAALGALIGRLALVRRYTVPLSRSRK